MRGDVRTKLPRFSFRCYTKAYAEEEAKTARDLEIAQGQLRDYEARLGGTFGHEAYLEELTSLRDSLEAALSSTMQAFDTESIVASIKALKAAHTIEAAPERTARKTASIEAAVTTRIMQRAAEAVPVQQAPEQPETQPVHIALPPAPVATERTAEIMMFKMPVPRARKPKATFQQRVRRDTRQMSLF
jgi:hypothetical protein